MIRDIEKLKNRTFDLLVIGGGINGAAIAHTAALRGLKTALVEKNDFASGTSSKSSKLVHGGIRYLENFQFPLVSEALKERHFHLKKAPHLVRPLPFVIPVYKEDRRPLWMMRLGVTLYDFLAGRCGIQKHRSLSRKEVLAMEPNLRREGLKGGVLYYDAQMDDSRLCLENVLSAAGLGVCAANYVEVTGFIKEDGRARGARARDCLAQDSPPFEIRAHEIFCAAGPWTNRFLKMDDPRAAEKVRPTKGVHIVTPEKISNNALLIPSGRDQRIFFVLPWKGNTMIGTTDTDYSGDPDKAAPDEEDIAYLLEETKRVFPGVSLERSGIRTAFAGLRPLVRHEGSASGVPREHSIFRTSSGLWFVAGGKYTTYRTMARECVDRLENGPSIENLFGSGENSEPEEETARRYGLDREVVSQLRGCYGSRAADVLKMTETDPALKQKICPQLPLIRAQLVYAEKVEMARTPEDILERRLGLAYAASQLEACRGEILEAISQICFKG